MFLEIRRGAEASRKPAGRLDRFLPGFDVRERHELVVHAPARLVLDTARQLDSLQALELGDFLSGEKSFANGSLGITAGF